MMTTAHWQTQAGQWSYSRVYDANDDDVIDAIDMQLFAAEWGWSNP